MEVNEVIKMVIEVIKLIVTIVEVYFLAKKSNKK